MLLIDQTGPSFYLPPRLGVDGLADLGAAIKIDGELLSDHATLLLAGRADTPRRRRAPAKKRAARS